MKKQSGFTLVEFSVAMAITLVALLATVMAFRMATYSHQNVTQREDMADNIRAGLNLLEQDVIMTGMGVPIGGITIPTFAPTSRVLAALPTWPDRFQLRQGHFLFATPPCHPSSPVALSGHSSPLRMPPQA